MKISAAALLFLILAAALGPSTQASLRRSHPTPIPVPTAVDTGIRETNHSVTPHSGVQRPGGCCLSDITGIIKCKIMIDYVRRINGCSLPAIVFKTNDRLEICASPSSDTVKQCMEHLDSIRRMEEPWDEEVRQ